MLVDNSEDVAIGENFLDLLGTQVHFVRHCVQHIRVETEIVVIKYPLAVIIT